MFGKDGNEFAEESWNETTTAGWAQDYTPRNMSGYDEGRPRK